jgi:hypothetical protein
LEKEIGYATYRESDEDEDENRVHVLFGTIGDVKEAEHPKRIGDGVRIDGCRNERYPLIEAKEDDAEIGANDSVGFRIPLISPIRDEEQEADDEERDDGIGNSLEIHGITSKCIDISIIALRMLKNKKKSLFSTNGEWILN